MPIEAAHLSAVRDVASLLDFLHAQLRWEIDPEDVDAATFTFSADELGLAAGDVPSIQAIRQLRLPSSHIGWGVYVMDFGNEPFRRTHLRRILNALAQKGRALQGHRHFAFDNILFACIHSANSLTLGHFTGDKLANARLRTFGWSDPRRSRTVCRVNLPALDWRLSKSWHKAWSTQEVTREFFDHYSRFFEKWRTKLILNKAGREAPVTDTDTQYDFLQKAMNRLIFLAFLQRKEWLQFGEDSAKRSDYLYELYSHWRASPGGELFYNNRLRKLFFNGLNQQDPTRRAAAATSIGQVPYLNGGLFDETDFDSADDPGGMIVLPDEMFDELFADDGLLRAYNFTTVESFDDTDQDVAVDPEMLGRIFEKLVLDRKKEGKYYTPRIVVRFMCRETLKAYLGHQYDALVEAPNLDERKRVIGTMDGDSIREAQQRLLSVMVVDPACGSGAYLLGMLHELFELLLTLELSLNARTEAQKYELKQQIIQRNIYGVDLDEFAVGIAMLRLWLSLVVDSRLHPLDNPGDDVSLPNLKFKIREGESLAAPNPTRGMATSGEYVARARRLKELHDEFFLPDSHRERERDAVDAEILETEAAIERTLEFDPAPEGSFDWRAKFAEVFAPETAHSSIKGFDIVVANPPYGVKVEDSIRDSYFDRRAEGAQSKDSFGIFMARALQLLRENGHMCFIVSDTWRTIKSHLPLRKRLLQQATVQHFIDLPSWIFDATVNTSILTLQKREPEAEHRVVAADLRPVQSGDWHTLEENLSAIANHGPDLQTLDFARYTYPQSDFATYENCSFFIASPKLYRFMSDPRFQKLGDIADVKVGLQTGDNEYYLRKREGVRGSYRILDESKLLTDEEIAGLSDDEKRNGVDPERYRGRHFVPYDKGGESDADEGWMPNYWVPTGYFIDWSQAAVTRLRTATLYDIKSEKEEWDKIKDGDEDRIASRFQNSQYYFRQGITFSRTGIYAPTYRLSSSSAFDTEGSVICSDVMAAHPMLGLLSARLNRYLIKSIVDHTVHAQVEDVKEILIPSELSGHQIELTAHVAAIVDNQKLDSNYPYHLHEQKRIDEIVDQLYGLNDDDIREVTLWYCRRYRALAQAQGVLAEAREKYADHLAWCDFILSKPPGYWSSHPLLKLIAQGEGERLEFKQSLEYVDPQSPAILAAPENARQTKLAETQRAVVHSSLKTICAFLNAPCGGSLLIGVHDKGEIVGIAPDLAMLGRSPSNDGFENKLRTLIRDRFTNAVPGNIQMSFHPMADARTVCEVDVPPSPNAVYLDDKLYVRDGNGTIELAGPQLEAWLRSRS